MATKVSPFMANYGRELRMGGDIRKKEKVESATEFVEKMKKVQEEAGAALRKTQEEMKKYADRGRREGNRSVEKGRSGTIEHEGSSVQGKTNKKVDGEIRGSVCDRGGCVVERSKITTAKFDENSSGSKCKPDNAL